MNDTMVYWENIRKSLRDNLSMAGDHGTVADQIRILDKVIDWCGKLQTEILAGDAVYSRKTQKSRQGSGKNSIPPKYQTDVYKE